jgi:hypothetical protein
MKKLCSAVRLFFLNLKRLPSHEGPARGVTLRPSGPIRSANQGKEGVFSMNPGWTAVTIIGVFIIVFALLNIIEKGRAD